MKLGNKTIFLTLLLLNFFYSSSSAEDKITSTPLLNLNELKPSFEELEKINENASSSEKIKVKKSKKTKSQSPHAILIGLDKITAKSSELIVNFDQTKKFGPLEIRILKCGKVKIHNKINDVAYNCNCHMNFCFLYTCVKANKHKTINREQETYKGN